MKGKNSKLLAELLEQLQRPHCGKHEAIIAQLEQFSEVFIIPHLFTCLIHKDPRVVKWARESLERRVQLLNCADLSYLDIVIRSVTGGYRYYDPEGKTGGLVDLYRDSVELLGLISFHCNGYIRQAAIEGLSKYQSGAELPFLLLRLNDWVPQVRGVAEKTVYARLAPTHAPHFFRYLPLVMHLETCGRIDHIPFVQLVRRLLISPVAIPTLNTLWEAPERKVRITGLNWLLEAGLPETPEFLNRALNHSDSALRLTAVRFIRTKLGQEENRAYFVQAQKDRNPQVRREALYACVEHQLETDLKSFLLDRSAVVRNAARYYLRESGFKDFAEFYRKHLQSHPDSAIEGLGETGAVSDATDIAPFSESERVGTSKAALRALGKLGKETYLPLFLRKLDHTKAGISRQAAEELSKFISSVDPEVLWKAVHGGRTKASQRNALRLVIGLPKWKKLELLLRTCALHNPEIPEIAVPHIKLWLKGFNRNLTTPKPEELAAIREALLKVEKVLGDELCRNLKYYLT